MKKKSSALACAVTLVLGVAAAPAHAQFMGVFQGVTNAIGQVAGKVTNRAFAGNGEDLQAAYDKFFGQIDAQTAGMDESSRRQHRALLEQQWPTLEKVILLKNAQIQREKEAPLLDVKQVAGAAIGGMALQAGMSNAIAGAGGGMADVMRPAAMGGILDGAQAKAVDAIARTGTPAPASAADLEFEPGDVVHPLKFFGKHPAELVARDLYRENGFIGWKRVDKGTAAEAYAPITGQGQAQAAVYNFDPETGAMKAAFRILSANPVAFTSAVAAYAKMLGAEPRYASTGSVLRAVWESGAFVTADGSRLVAGWSSLVPGTYSASVARPAAK